MSDEVNQQFDKLDQFYESCLHRNASNLTSLNSVLYQLDSIYNITNHRSSDLAEALGYLATHGIFPFFQLKVVQVRPFAKQFNNDISLTIWYTMFRMSKMLQPTV